MEPFSAEPWVEVFFPCTRCEGEGKIRVNEPGTQFVPGLHDPPCPVCKRKGFVKRCLRPGEFRELFSA